MSEEIKEILEIFKKINEEYSVDTELDFEDYEIPNIYLKQFLDYITNLQKENKKLKELCDKYEEEHSTTFQIWKYNKDTYKSRCEKAIDKLYCYGEVFDGKILQQFQKEMLDTLQGVDKVLNILQGSDKE